MSCYCEYANCLREIIVKDTATTIQPRGDMYHWHCINEMANAGVLMEYATTGSGREISMLRRAAAEAPSMLSRLQKKYGKETRL